MMRNTKRYCLVIWALLLAFLLSACGKTSIPQPVKVDDKSPEKLVEGVFQMMKNGNLSPSLLVLGKDLDETIKEPNLYPYFMFGITNVSLSEYDKDAHTIDYSCVIPHPSYTLCMLVKKIKGMPSYYPGGYELKGTFLLQGNETEGFRIKVDTPDNPIALYINLADSSKIEENKALISGMTVTEEEKTLTSLLMAVEDYYKECIGSSYKMTSEEMVAEMIKVTESIR